ncbi:MAG: ABC transporter substrate-binding protein [Thiolinea sp.]
MFWAWFFFCSLCVSQDSVSAEIYLASQTTANTEKLQIFSSTDEQAMRPLLTDFQELYPEVSIEYIELDSLPLFERFLNEAKVGTTADILISSAMDLQIKLVNDGYAATHEIGTGLNWLPDWAQWRNQAFGFTYEPAVMIYNPGLLSPDAIPQSRFQLIDLLRKQQSDFQGKVGTYDITRSGFGYLLASQDAQQASTWGRLTESLSRAKAELYENTSSMLQAVQSGELLLAYNVLGSYAFTQAQNNPNLAVILPTDYTLVMSRIAFVPRQAANSKVGHWFLDYLLSERGQQLLADSSGLYPIHPDIKGLATYSGLQQSARERGPLKRIKLGPALLTYQDSLKKRHFLREWLDVMN